MVGGSSSASARLSTKAIPARERLIFPLDVPTPAEALAWVERLGDAVHFYKLGLEIFLAGRTFELIDELVGRREKKVFADLKLFDVPETVSAAVRQLAGCGATFLTVHGNDAMLEAACREKGDLGILAVTVLTSLDRGDLDALGFRAEVRDVVLSRAERALACGCDGVISSGLEAAALRESLGDRFLVVSPGIRPLENRLADDQKRVVTPEQAFANGADYIVVGRPIRKAPDPVAKANEMQATIAKLFG